MKISSNSFDYAVLEKAKDIYAIKLDIPWSDLGSWKEICKMYNKNKKSYIKKSNIFYKFRDFLNSVHGKTMYHVDHIIPLAKGGTHSFKNLAIATASYNQWKRARIITDPSIYFGSSQIK